MTYDTPPVLYISADTSGPTTRFKASPRMHPGAKVWYTEETVDALRDALRRIEAWELPASGRFYPNADGSDSNRPAPYDSVYGWGSEGGKSAIRAIARAALAALPAPDEGEQEEGDGE